jgi:FtsX-like permease family
MIARVRRVWVPLWLAARRLRHRPERVVLVVLGIAAAAAALAAMQAGTLVAQDRSVADRIASLPAETRAIRLASFSVAGQSDPYRVLDGRARRALTPLLNREPIATVLYRETTIAGAYVGLGAVDGLAPWIQLETGRLPRPCTPARCEVVELRGSGGGELPDAPGLRLVRVGRGDFSSTTLFGDAIPAANSARSEANLSEAYQRSSRYHLPAPPPLVLAEGVARLSSSPVLQSKFRTFGWVVPIERGSVHFWSTAALVRSIDRARARLEAQSAAAYELRAPLDELEDVANTSTVAGRRLLLVGGQASALLLAFALLSATRMRRDVGAAGQRLTWLGTPDWQIGLAIGAEAALLALVGTAVGWAAGTLAAGAIARESEEPVTALLRNSVLDADGIVLALAVAAAGTAALVLALAIRPVRLRALSLSWLDLAALAAAAIVAATFLRGRADAEAILDERGTGSVLLLLPGLIAFVAAVAVARALPPALLGLERLIPAKAVAGRLMALGLARNPGYAAVAVAFVAVSVGLALFAEAYRSTLARGQRDEARYAAPADFIVREDLSRLVPVRDAVRPADLRSLGADVRPSVVLRMNGSIQGARDVTGVTVLGLDRASVEGVDGWRSDFADAGLATLADRVVSPNQVAITGPSLPPRATRLLLPVRVRGRSFSMAATIRAPDSSFVTVTLGTAEVNSATTLSAALPGRARGGELVALRFDPPVRLVERGSDAGGVAQSTVTLEPVVAATSTRRGFVTDYDDWRGVDGARLVSRAPLRLRLTLTGRTRTWFRPTQPTDGRPVPVLASPAVANAAGADGELSLDLAGEQVPARVAAVARRFPGTSQGTFSGDFAIADRDVLGTALDVANPGVGTANEIWIEAATSDGRTRIAERLGRPPFDVLAVTEQHRVEESLRDDPLARAASLMLFAAAIIAVVLAFLGLALGVVSELRDERGELVDLEAQGLGPARLRRHLRLRAAAVLGFGLAGAAALGLALSSLVLSVVLLTANTTEPVPPLVLTIDWPLLVGILVATLALAALIIAALTARAFRERSAGRYTEVGT